LFVRRLQAQLLMCYTFRTEIEETTFANIVKAGLISTDNFQVINHTPERDE